MPKQAAAAGEVTVRGRPQQALSPKHVMHTYPGLYLKNAPEKTLRSGRIPHLIPLPEVFMLVSSLPMLQSLLPCANQPPHASAFGQVDNGSSCCRHYASSTPFSSVQTETSLACIHGA